MKTGRRFSGIKFRPVYLLFLVVLILVVKALGSLPFREVLSILQQLSPLELLILAGVNLLVFSLFSSRWWWILRTHGASIPYISLLGYRLAGFSMSYFTPGPQFGGEPLLVHLTRTRQGIHPSTAVAAVTLDKLLELMVNFSFLTAGVFLILRAGLFGAAQSMRISVLLASVLILLLSYLIALWAGWSPLARLVQKLPVPPLRRFQPTLAEAEQLLNAYFRNQPTALLGALFFSIITWLAMLIEFYLMTRLLGLTLTFPQTIFTLTAARLAFMTPSPGGLGALEAGQALSMQMLGIHPAYGLSLSLLIRFRDLCFGGIGIWLTMFYLRRSRMETQVVRAED